MNRKISTTLLTSMLIVSLAGCESATEENTSLETTKQELASHDAPPVEDRFVQHMIEPEEEAEVEEVPAADPAPEPVEVTEVERKRQLAAEAQNKTIMGQIGSVSADGGSGSLIDVLGEGAGNTSMDESFAGSSGVIGAEKSGLGSVGAKSMGVISERGIGVGDVSGSGGLGMRGAGRGGGGEGTGRLVGLGNISTGSGKGYAGKAAKVPRVHAARTSGVLGVRSQGAQKPQPGPQVPSSHDPVGSESYKDHGVNPMTETSKDRFSTFAVDVDTGAYTISRRKLNSGYKPPAASVRVEEFINYFSYNYPNPDSGAFGVNLEAAPSPFSVEKDRYVVRVGVQGKRIAAKDRKPVHLTFLVDVSGSMNRPDKLGLAKESLKILTRNLKRGDTVALATYAGNTRVVLTPTSNKTQILDAIDNLRSGGGTAMSSGMELAYKQALSSYRKGHVNRVIVLSDGDANIGRTSFDDILATIKSYVDEGVTLSTIGFGMGNYKDSLMEQLANKGNGNYYYIDDIKEARKVFGEQIDGTLEVIAKDVKIQVEFNPDAVSQYRLIGYENRDIADKDFRNDAVDAGEIGAGHSVTALYEVVMDPTYKGSLAYVRVRHKEPEGHKASEQIFMLNAGSVAAKLSDASKDFQFAAAVAGFAEILRGSKYAEHLSYALIEEIAQAASSSSQKDRQEFIGLVRKAKAM